MPEHRPTFSIVSAVYNVAAYLPDYIGSIERQAFGLDRVEVIAVDDGSTDDSGAILEDWRRRRPGLVTVLAQPNAGISAARNLALARATGEWVTFTDPDDMLDERFLEVSAAFATAHPDVDAMASKILTLDEVRGGVRDHHPRRAQFRAGNRVADLSLEPGAFIGKSTNCLFRLDRVRDRGIEFDGRIRPTFEDSHFSARFVLGLEPPRVGLLRDARYLYRIRRTLDSAVQRAWGDPGRFSAVLEHGYLDLIERAKAAHGEVPAWLQNVLIYELSYYLAEDARPGTRAVLPPELEASFHEQFAAVARELDPALVHAFRLRPWRPAFEDLLVHGFRDEDWHEPALRRERVDRVMGLQRLAYRVRGPLPSESFQVDGRPVEPAWSKTRAMTFFGRPVLCERLLWLPTRGSLEATVGSDVRPIVEDSGEAGAAGPPSAPVGAGRADARSGAWPRVRATLASAARAAVNGSARVVARSPVGARYRDAWVLMDGVHEAGDNGERLFEHLRRRRPDVNAWFVVRRGTPDWDRLRRRGESRLVSHGSFRWKVLMQRCAWLLASHAGPAITSPPALQGVITTPGWRFGDLGHGVIKEDLSRQMNEAGIDLLAVSTGPELASIVADGTGYRLTAKEARLTGMPRFDRLLQVGRAVPEAERDLVLVAPTWRSWLLAHGAAGGRRRILLDGAWHSDWLQAWVRLLGAPEIGAAATALGLRVGFLPHPAMEPILRRLALPPNVTAITHAGTDLQRLYARCALLVTDDSSVAFDIAALDRPVVYYQFDRERVAAGGHVGRPGYFDAERDGFGPVATGHDGAVAAIVEALEAGAHPSPPYQGRIDRTFPFRDGRACERVVAAIEALGPPA